MDTAKCDPQVWVLERRRRWGDYGTVLMHGMTSHLEPVDGCRQLERTGPYVPPITLPGLGDLLATDETKRALEDGGITGVSFIRVHNARIVRLDWHTWPRDADEPAEYPASGAPEDYILGRPHDAALADAIGHMWEVRRPHPGGPIARRTSERNRHYTMEADAVPEVDVFSPSTLRIVCVTERGRARLAPFLTDAIELLPVEIGPLPEEELPRRRLLPVDEPIPPKYEDAGTTVHPFTKAPCRVVVLRK